MSIAALVLWIVTVSFGSYMARIWLSHGGSSGGATHFRRARVFAHLGLAVAGLIVWIIYLATDSSVWAWIAVIDLVLVGVLGGLLFGRWSADGRAAMSGRTAGGPDLAEQHINRPPVVLHGIFAASTFIVVLLTALSLGPGT